MSLTLGTFMAFPATPTSVGLDGRTVIDPGSASIVRVTSNADAANSYLCGIKGGVDGRVLVLMNASGASMKVAHDYDAEATVADQTERIRIESGAYTIGDNGAKLLIYIGTGYWQMVGA